MSKAKANWPISIGFGIALGLASLVILKNSLRDSNPREHRKVMLDLKLIKQAVEQYKKFHGFYPVQSKNRLLDFAEQLSDEQPSPNLKKSRKMYVDYAQNLMVPDNENYAAPNADPATLLDPWMEPYMYTSNGKTFTVWSTGPDKVNSNGDGDDISQINLIKGEDTKLPE